MTSLIAGTWTLISSSAEIITGARRMTLRIHRLLQPGLLELSEGDRRRLLGLQKRVDCLVQPLNFLLLWSKHRDSCVQQVILNAQELLSDVCAFVDRYFPQDCSGSSCLGGSAKAPGPGRDMCSEQLEYYLRELEFACASVSMAVSIARATEGSDGGGGLEEGRPQRGGQGPKKNADTGRGGPLAAGISLSALLRASRRIQEMSGRSGDLCACLGRLYIQPLAGEGDSELRSEMHRKYEVASWSPLFSLAAFKVVAVADGRLRRRRYGISVESRLPLTQSEEDGGALASGVDAADVHGPLANDGGLNSSGPHTFPIEVALDACLTVAAHLGLPPADPLLSDLGVDELVLYWTAPRGSSTNGTSTAGAELQGGRQPLCDAKGVAPGGRCAADAAHGGGSSSGCACGDPAEEVSSELDAVLLPEAVPDRMQRPFWDRCRAASPRLLARTASAPLDGSRYAFVFDGRRRSAELGSEQEVLLTPLDALYLARLCAHDNGQFHSALPSEVASNGFVGEAAGCPPHLLSSDEVLAALLLQPHRPLAATPAAAAVVAGGSASSQHLPTLSGQSPASTCPGRTRTTLPGGKASPHPRSPSDSPRPVRDEVDVCLTVHQ